MEIERSLYQRILQNLVPNKVNLIMGTRRVGKTFLVKKIISQTAYKVLMLEGEDMQVQALLAETSIANYTRLLSGTELLKTIVSQKSG